VVVFVDIQVLESRKLVDYQFNCCIRYQRTPCALDLPVLKRQAGLFNAGFTLPKISPKSKITRNGATTTSMRLTSGQLPVKTALIQVRSTLIESLTTQILTRVYPKYSGLTLYKS
jgi:hypothetical protein